MIYVLPVEIYFLLPHEVIRQSFAIKNQSHVEIFGDSPLLCGENRYSDTSRILSYTMISF